MHTLKSKIVPQSEIQTTCSPYMAAECDEAITFTTCNDSEKSLSVLYVEYGECGLERKSDWMRFVNKLNNYDITPIKRMITGDKKVFDGGLYKVSREDIEYSEDGLLFEFNEPVNIIVEAIGDNYVIVEATKIRGELNWEWMHKRTGHEDLKGYAGVCEVFISEVEIIE